MLVVCYQAFSLAQKKIIRLSLTVTMTEDQQWVAFLYTYYDEDLQREITQRLFDALQPGAPPEHTGRMVLAVNLGGCKPGFLRVARTLVM